MASAAAVPERNLVDDDEECMCTSEENDSHHLYKIDYDDDDTYAQTRLLSFLKAASISAGFPSEFIEKPVGSGNVMSARINSSLTELDNSLRLLLSP